MDIDAFSTLTIAFLCFALFVIAVIPSGPECPTCNKYFTSEMQYKHVSKTTSKISRVKYTACFVCKKYFNITINGISKKNLKELEEPENNE